MEILQNFVALSEFMNFIKNILCDKNLGVNESKFSDRPLKHFDLAKIFLTLKFDSLECPIFG